MTRRQAVVAGVSVLFYALLAVFVIVYLTRIDYRQLASARVDLPVLALAAVVTLVSRYWGVVIWLVILRGLGARGLRGSLLELNDVYSRAWLGRYIPGTAPWVLGKIFFASQHGIAKAKLAVSSLLEAGLQIIVLMVLSSAFLLIDPRLDVLGAWTRIGMIAVVLLGVVILLPPVFNRLVGIASRLLRRGPVPPEHLVTGSVLAQGAGLDLVGAVLSGFSLFLVARAVDPALSGGELLFVLATAGLAVAAGMLAIFAPGGIGVREGIQLALLSVVMPTEYALVVTVLARVLEVVVDLLFVAINRGALIAGRRRATAAPDGVSPSSDGSSPTRRTGTTRP